MNNISIIYDSMIIAFVEEYYILVKYNFTFKNYFYK